MNLKDERVYSVVQEIPLGKVLTYKAVAQRAGVSNPRHVGRILHNNPDQENIPCHRVVSSQGKVATAFAFGGGKKQREMLEEEGIVFEKDKIDLGVYLMD